MLCVNNYCSAHEPLLVLGVNDYLVSYAKNYSFVHRTNTELRANNYYFTLTTPTASPRSLGNRPHLIGAKLCLSLISLRARSGVYPPTYSFIVLPQ